MKGNPFRSDLALKNSSLHWASANGLTASENYTRFDPFTARAHDEFRRFVIEPAFSCIGAKAAFHSNAYGFGGYDRLGSVEATAGLCHDLCCFTQSKLVDQSEFATFVAVFGEPKNVDEQAFEQLLWQQLRQLHIEDRAHFNWDSSVSANPKDPHFSFSFAGRAFYVVGMHGNSSRTARRFSWPALVFNPHEQFQRMRTDGKWRRMQNSIRAREVVLQGSVNPMLNDFGERSEARQYSGRDVPDDWIPPVPKSGKCPFGH